MDNQSDAAGNGGTSDAGSVLQIREDWRLARNMYKELQVVGRPGTNLLLVGNAGTIRIVMELLWQDLHEPILTWRPGPGSNS